MNKQITFAALMAVLMSFVCPMRGWAQEVTIDDVRYSLNNKATVIGCDKGKQGKLVIPASVSYENVEYSVTTIGFSAFKGCSALTSIVIPESVTEILWTVFLGCSSLTTIDVSSDNLNYSSLDGVLYNKNKSELLTCPEGKKSVIIPESVTTIDFSAFENCSGLTSIVIPEGVTTIGNSAFAHCSSLTTIDVSSDNLNYSSLDGVLYNKDKSELLTCPGGKESIIIPEGVTSIGRYAFGGCTGLTSIVIPEGVTTIGNAAFEGCTGLTSIALPEGVTSIGESAFSGCTGLTSITLPESVTSIGMGAFAHCSGLTSIVIPEGVTEIGFYFFSNCTGLTSITLPGSLTSIDKISAFSGCSSLTTIDVSSDNLNFSSLDGVLYNKDKSELVICPKGKESIIIPEGVTTIGNSAFYACSGLTSIALPEGVTSIGESAFWDCTGLTSIALPEGVTSIGEFVFNGCSSLKTIYSKSAEPPLYNCLSVLGGSSFPPNPDAVAYVPVGSKAAYEAAKGWNELTIEEFDFADVASSSIAPSFTAYATSGGVVLSAVEGEAEVAVYNLQGVALYRGTVSAGETVVALPSGSYVVRAGNGKGELVMVP